MFAYSAKTMNYAQQSLIIVCAQGMKYLHDSRVMSHGRLSSKNVVIDNQFVCKVTDYGLPLFRSGDARSLVMKDLGESTYWLVRSIWNNCSVTRYVCLSVSR